MTTTLTNTTLTPTTSPTWPEPAAVAAAKARIAAERLEKEDKAPLEPAVGFTADQVLKLDALLERYRSSMVRAVLDEYPPLYSAVNRDTWGIDLRPLKRRPKGAQADAIRAAVVSLKRYAGTNIVGEMGTGKTYVGAAAAFLAGMKRILVLCPPHLTRKWKREVEMTVPGAEAVIVKTVADFEKAYRDKGRYPGVVQFVIVSRESAKLGANWQPTTWVRPRRVYVLGKRMLVRDEKTGEPEEECVCPGCHQAAFGWAREGRSRKMAWQPLTPELLAKKKWYCEWLNKATLAKTLARQEARANREAAKADTEAQASPNPDEIVETKVDHALRRDRRNQCRYPLWGPDARNLQGTFRWAPELPPATGGGKGPRRIALADYLVKRRKRYFDLLIPDEQHEYKARESAQGIAAGQLAEASGRKSLTLTGTLSGGYASTLFYLLWRFVPEIRRDFALDDVGRWVTQYGIVERITKLADDDDDTVGRSSKRKEGRTTTKERPGITPSLLHRLLPSSVFLRLADVTDDLPPVTDEVQIIGMDERWVDVTTEVVVPAPEPGKPPVVSRTTERQLAPDCQAGAYKKLMDALYDEVKSALARGDKRLLGALLQAGLAYPDACWRGETVAYPPVRDPRTGVLLPPQVVATAPALPEDTVYPKERVLLDEVGRERGQQRRCIVYVTHTESRDITARLKRLLETEGNRVAVLKADTVPSDQREDWIADQVKRGTNVVLCHPKLVQTGLDLIDWPTLLWFETEYSVYVTRQASRRSWRIGQTKPVRVPYLVYDKTLQATALRLIASKAKSSLLVEGEMAEGGLTDQAGAEDVQIALARSLVHDELAAGGESLEALFAQARESEAATAAYLDARHGTLAAETDALPPTGEQEERERFVVRLAEEFVAEYEQGRLGEAEAEPEPAPPVPPTPTPRPTSPASAFPRVLPRLTPVPHPTPPPAPAPPPSAVPGKPRPTEQLSIFDLSALVPDRDPEDVQPAPVQPAPVQPPGAPAKPVVRTVALDAWAAWAAQHGKTLDELRHKGKGGARKR